jgi:hypothetical protein
MEEQQAAEIKDANAAAAAPLPVRSLLRSRWWRDGRRGGRVDRRRGGRLVGRAGRRAALVEALTAQGRRGLQADAALGGVLPRAVRLTLGKNGSNLLDLNKFWVNQ